MTSMTSIGQMAKVALRKDLAPGSTKAVEVKGQKVIILCAGGDYFALENHCSGCGGELQDGKIAGGMIACPRCGSMYYYRHGGVKRAPATHALKVYELRYDSEAVYLGSEKDVKIKEHRIVSKETPIKW